MQIWRITQRGRGGGSRNSLLNRVPTGKTLQKLFHSRWLKLTWLATKLSTDLGESREDTREQHAKGDSFAARSRVLPRLASLIHGANVLFSGHPEVGGVPGEPPVICKTTFTNPPYPKPRLFNKKLLTPLRGGQRSLLCQVKGCNISRVLFVINNFLFTIIIHITVN